MLVIISDLHLTDGTSGTTISVRAFKIFRERLREMAYEASWLKDGSYRPIENIDLILLGDILDVIRSTKWLDEEVRPWSDTAHPDFIRTVQKINQSILTHNEASFSILKGLNSDDNSKRITLPPADESGGVSAVGHEPEAIGRIPVNVNIHYMIGNHDWFYHLKGEAYNDIRQSVVGAMGLANNFNEPFAHDPAESSVITKAMDSHNVFARHGDIYDPFNYEGDRDASSLGDAIVVEILNRFPVEVGKQLGDKLPKAFLEGLNEIDNVRPLLMIPVWIDALIDKSNIPELAGQVKEIWNTLAEDLLNLDFIKERDDWKDPLDEVDKLQLALKFSNKFSFHTIAKIIRWFNKKNKGSGDSYYKSAMKEQAYKDKKAFIVYGHTHHSEVVALNSVDRMDQLHINSGTWRAVFEMAKADTKFTSFAGYKVMTYLAFFKNGERGGRKFESWSGSLG